MSIPIVIPMLYLLLPFAAYLVVRREWLAWEAVWLLFTLLFALPLLGPSPLGNALTLVGYGLRTALWTFVLARFGLLVGSGRLCVELLAAAPLTSDLSAWYAPYGVVMALVLIGLAVYAFVTATRGGWEYNDGLFGDNLIAGDIVRLHCRGLRRHSYANSTRQGELRHETCSQMNQSGRWAATSQELKIERLSDGILPNCRTSEQVETRMNF